MQFNPKYARKYNKEQGTTKILQNGKVNFKAHEITISKPIKMQKNYESKVERIQLRKWNG